jgi:hypothetical protein
VSRYLILIILNLPLILLGILNAVVNYKLGHTIRKRFVFKILFWSIILAGILFAEPIYSFLFSNHLTQTEPLSLFDVMQITGIILTIFIANQAYGKAELLERKVQDLHQELSIRLSNEEAVTRDSKKA